MVSGWPEVRSCDQLVLLPSVGLGHEPGLLGSRVHAHNIPVYLLISLRAPALIPRPTGSLQEQQTLL